MSIERIHELDAGLVSYLFQAAGMEVGQANGRFFQAEDNILLVAKEDGEPAGFLYAYILEAPHALRPKMFLYSIDVFSQVSGARGRRGPDRRAETARRPSQLL